MGDEIMLLAVPAVLILGGGMMYWQFSRSSRHLQEWARRNGYELLDVQRRIFRRGTFWWRVARGQEVFRVTVRRGDGVVRSGYVRVGGWFTGQLSGHATEEWDD